jgi:hypothetical protein
MVGQVDYDVFCDNIAEVAVLFIVKLTNYRSIRFINELLWIGRFELASSFPQKDLLDCDRKNRCFTKRFSSPSWYLLIF